MASIEHLIESARTYEMVHFLAKTFNASPVIRDRTTLLPNAVVFSPLREIPKRDRLESCLSKFYEDRGYTFEIRRGSFCSTILDGYIFVGEKRRGMLNFTITWFSIPDLGNPRILVSTQLLPKGLSSSLPRP